jgi:hypothetical protein
MSTSAEPAPSSLDTVGATSTPDVPSPTPATVNAGLKGDPLADDMKKALAELNNASGEMDPDKDNNPPDPAKEESALDKAKGESDRLREIMMRQQGMGRDKMTLPIVEEMIKAFIKVLKAIWNKIFGKKDDPSGPAASPQLLAKRNETMKSIEKTEVVLDDVQKEAEKAKQAELDKDDVENDGASPGSPGAKAMAPK